MWFYFGVCGITDTECEGWGECGCRGEGGRPIIRLCRFPLLLTAIFRPRAAAVCEAFEAFGVAGVSKLA